MSDKARTQKDYELDVPKGAGFQDLVALKGNAEIGDKMNQVVAKLAKANDLKGVIDLSDWNDPDKLGRGKEMVDRLSRLIGIFEALDFGANRADGDDLLGDAYEYLMRHFATESGKSKGQFYTPAEVSRVMAHVVGVTRASSGNQSIHDPTCGSGSLLIRAHDEAKHATGYDLALYGQEKDNATKALARMNTILHNCTTAVVWQDNTLTAPHFTEKGGLKTFDFVVANPPFSDKAWSNGLNTGHDEFERFGFGVPPQKNGDYAYLLHILACMKSTGKGAVVLPHGVLFRGNAEAEIRKALVKRGLIQGIIGLPPNLFYGTGIPACIIVLDKEGAAKRKGIFMLDASKGFLKDGNKNRLRAQDIHKIVDTFTRKLELPRYARMVPLTEISDPKNDYNLNLPRYIDASEPEDLQDLSAHLQGGIPQRDVDALSRYWEVLPGVRSALFAAGDRPGYSALRVPAPELKATIFDHSEFAAFQATVHKLLAKWQTKQRPTLAAIQEGDKPKAVIEALSESLLHTFEKAPLLDAYDVYQHLMDYWEQAMQDDVYLIVADGWREAARPQAMLDDKKSKDKPDLVVGKKKLKMELIPPALVIARYFAKEKAELDELEAKAAAAGQAVEDFVDENTGEEGLLEEAKNDAGKVSKASAKARLKLVEEGAAPKDEWHVLREYLQLVDDEARAWAAVSAADEVLKESVLGKYQQMTEDAIKTLVIDDKWLTALRGAVEGELDRVSQTLTGRVRELGERYAKTVGELAGEVQELERRVREHLRKMGGSWR